MLRYCMEVRSDGHRRNEEITAEASIMPNTDGGIRG